jgi:hypothetical protein
MSALERRAMPLKVSICFPFLSSAHARIVRHAKAIRNGRSMDCLYSHGLAGFVSKRAKWRYSWLKDADHRPKHRLFSRWCQHKLRHRTNPRQFLSPKPGPLWRVWCRQLSFHLIRGPHGRMPLRHRSRTLTRAGSPCYIRPSRGAVGSRTSRNFETSFPNHDIGYAMLILAVFRRFPGLKNHK